LHGSTAAGHRGLEVGVGDLVTLFGATQITAQHVADWAGTNSYEILTGIASRVQRLYLEPR
ncbi:MAG: hypothetical protein HC933_15720, partial [Pleurocapsa sp. SU_196_0]|nr:hypothetical protein [Pleurocapsa sp. SU_196_0]